MKACETTSSSSNGVNDSTSAKKRPAKRFPGEHSKWTCSSNECINMKLVREEDELYDEDGYFHPVYTNQVYY